MPRFKPTAVKPTIEGFSGFRPKQWAADLPELSALNLSGGHLKVRCTLEDWDAESLRDLFEGEDYAAVDLEATPEADLPVYADCLNLVAVGETAFSQRTMLSQGNYPDSEARSRWMKELHTFNLLLTTGEPEAPAGFMQFNSVVQWPRPAGLQPEAIADWGEPPPLSVSLYLGGVWLRHAFRGRRWGASLVDAYWAVLRAELNTVVAQLEHIEPAEGPKHLVQVWLSAEYWSVVGQRLGTSVLQELERRTQDWLFLAKAKNVVLEIGVTGR